MYNAHRGIIPGEVPGGPSSRLTELLNQIRQEFENQAGRAGDYEHQLAQQIQEMDLVRQRISQLEQAQIQIKQKYDDDLSRLQRELEARGGPSQLSHLGGPPQHTGPPHPPPPSIGNGPSNLFGGIMAGSAAAGGPGLAPPPQEQPQGQGLQSHVSQGPPGLNSAPGPPQHAPFGGYQPGPSLNGYGPQPPQQTASPGPNKPRMNRGPPGLATPQQNQPVPYPESPQVPRPTPPPGQLQPHISLQRGVRDARDVGNQLGDLDPQNLHSSLKKGGEPLDWWAVFNPRIPRKLDVDLVHTLTHDSVVCCIRFSNDGKYVATGCNRTAQIFEVSTGKQVAHLQDETVDKDGDLYIRSVCFSQDGRYLATGAEDKVIRVWDIANRSVKNSFTGHDQDIYSLDFSRNGNLIASGSGDRTVRLWDMDSNQQVMMLQIEDGVTTVALSPDGRYVAAGSLDKSVRVWDAQSGFLVERLEGAEGHKDSVYSVAFAPNGRDLVSGSLDKTIKMWELSPPRGMLPGTGPKGGKCLRTFEGHKDFVLSVALTNDGQWVISGSKDRGVQFWDPTTGDAQFALVGHKNSVISVAPSPVSNFFATGSGDLRARIWSYGPYRG